VAIRLTGNALDTDTLGMAGIEPREHGQPLSARYYGPEGFVRERLFGLKPDSPMPPLEISPRPILTRAAIPAAETAAASGAHAADMGVQALAPYDTDTPHLWFDGALQHRGRMIKVGGRPWRNLTKDGAELLN